MVVVIGQNSKMWQFCVEIEGYSVVYFDCIAAFEAPFRWTSIKGGAHKFIRYSCIYEARMSPALSRSSAIRRFKHSNAIEIRDRITFDFYTELLQIDCFDQCGLSSGASLAGSWTHWLLFVKYLTTCKGTLPLLNAVSKSSTQYLRRTIIRSLLLLLR